MNSPTAVASKARPPEFEHLGPSDGHACPAGCHPLKHPSSSLHACISLCIELRV